MLQTSAISPLAIDSDALSNALWHRGRKSGHCCWNNVRRTPLCSSWEGISRGASRPHAGLPRLPIGIAWEIQIRGRDYEKVRGDLSFSRENTASLSRRPIIRSHLLRKVCQLHEGRFVLVYECAVLFGLRLQRHPFWICRKLRPTLLRCLPTLVPK